MSWQGVRAWTPKLEALAERSAMSLYNYRVSSLAGVTNGRKWGMENALAARLWLAQRTLAAHAWPLELGWNPIRVDKPKGAPIRGEQQHIGKVTYGTL